MPRRPIASATVLIAILMSAAVPLAAQDSRAATARQALCFHAKPKSACSSFLLTNVGPYYMVAGGHGSSSVHGWPASLRVVLDWGFMTNVSTRDAIGASVLASWDDAGPGLGLAARYRRWTSPRASFEFAIGASIPRAQSHRDIEQGSILGLVRWSPAPWFALTARPELLQHRDSPSRGRLSIGTEAGEVPGFYVTAASAVFGALVYFSTFWDCC